MVRTSIARGFKNQEVIGRYDAEEYLTLYWRRYDEMTRAAKQDPSRIQRLENKNARWRSKNNNEYAARFELPDQEGMDSDLLKLEQVFTKNSDVIAESRRRVDNVKFSADRLNRQRKPPRVVRSDVQNLGEDGERDRTATFAGRSGD